MLAAAPALAEAPEPAGPAGDAAVLPALPEPMPVPPDAAPVEPDAPPLMPDPAAVPPAVPPGCMAGEPDVADPEPVAVGRSEDGAVVVCARAGIVARAEATRHAAICVLSMEVSLTSLNDGTRSPRLKRSARKT
jgi:hypothetical protein